MLSDQFVCSIHGRPLEKGRIELNSVAGWPFGNFYDEDAADNFEQEKSPLKYSLAQFIQTHLDGRPVVEPVLLNDLSLAPALEYLEHLGRLDLAGVPTEVFQGVDRREALCHAVALLSKYKTENDLQNYFQERFRSLINGATKPAHILGEEFYQWCLRNLDYAPGLIRPFVHLCLDHVPVSASDKLISLEVGREKRQMGEIARKADISDNVILDIARILIKEDPTLSIETEGEIHFPTQPLAEKILYVARNLICRSTAARLLGMSEDDFLFLADTNIFKPLIPAFLRSDRYYYSPFIYLFIAKLRDSSHQILAPTRDELWIKKVRSGRSEIARRLWLGQTIVAGYAGRGYDYMDFAINRRSIGIKNEPEQVDGHFVGFDKLWHWLQCGSEIDAARLADLILQDSFSRSIGKKNKPVFNFAKVKAFQDAFISFIEIDQRSLLATTKLEEKLSRCNLRPAPFSKHLKKTKFFDRVEIESRLPELQN